MPTDEIGLQAGIDYLTTTWPADDSEQSLNHSALDEVLVRMYGAGYRSAGERWASLGYVGYQFGKVRTGERHDGHLLTVSGSDSHSYVEMKGPLGPNTTRIDLQVTFRAPDDVSLYIKQLKEIATVSRETLRGNYKISHIDGCGAGDTLYLGARSSDIFFRVYDKGEESGEEQYIGCVRFEVEFKGPRAVAALGRLRGGQSLSRACLETVAACFRGRGLDISTYTGAVGDVVRCPDRARSSAEESLIWLERQVRPTVLRLLSTVGRATIETALGLESTNVDRKETE